MANITNRATYTFDANLEFKDAGLVAATAAAQVDGSNKIVDLGEARWEGTMIFDVSAVEIASNDELYTVAIQGSDSSTFASGIQNLAMIDFGATEVRKGSAIDSLVGRHELPFTNVAGGTTASLGVTYRYARVHTTVAGSIATGINYTAWASKKM